jgi:hypothetical protein
MSLLSRPSVVFGIVIGCFAVLIPRVFIPIFRSKPSSLPSHNIDDRKYFPKLDTLINSFLYKDLRRPASSMFQNENGDTIEHIQVCFI